MCLLKDVYLLSQGDLNGDTESEIIAANDQALKENIMQQNIKNGNKEQRLHNTRICRHRKTHFLIKPFIEKRIIHQKKLLSVS